MTHNWHAGDRCIGPDRYGVIQRGKVLMREGESLLIEWDDRSLDPFGGEDVEKLAREDVPASVEAGAGNSETT